MSSIKKKTYIFCFNNIYILVMLYIIYNSYFLHIKVGDLIKMVKRLTVQFTDEQWKIIDKLEIGSNDASKVKNIVIAWLAEKSMITTEAKKKL